MQTISVYAQGYNDLSVEELNALESTFNCEEAFKSYKSFDNIYHTGYYFVENFEANNNKAFFSSTTP